MIEQTGVLIESSEPLTVPALDISIGSDRVIKKAARAGRALLFRQLLVYGANIGGSILLARLIPADQYGYYGIVLFLISFMSIFGGTGFAGNLIRTNEEPAHSDFEVMFTAQQAMILAIFAAIWAISPKLGTIYHMGAHGPWFFRMAGIALVLTSFMVMPQIKMERELAFDRLAMVEVCQAIGFNVSAIALALKGWGALSFSVALIVRSGIGAVLAYVSAPWKFGFRWDRLVLKKHLHYGVALQTGQVVSILKDSISPLFVGMLLGAADVGYVTWASSLAGYSIWVLLPLQRLYLPLFARLQSDPLRLKKVIEYVLWIVNAIVAPLGLVTLALSHPATTIVFGSRWVAALPLYYLICFSNISSPCVIPMLGVLNAMGQSQKTLYMSVIWMASTWLFGVPLTLWLGLKGFGIAIVCVQSMNFVLYRMVWRATGVSAWAAYMPSWPLAAGVGAALVLLQMVSPIHHITGLIAYGLAGLVAYALILWYGFPEKARAVVRLRHTQP